MGFFWELAGVREKDLRGVIEEPDDEIRRSIEKMRDSGDEGEIRNTGAEVAASEGDEAGKSDGNAEIMRIAAVLSGAGDDIGG